MYTPESARGAAATGAARRSVRSGSVLRLSVRLSADSLSMRYGARRLFEDLSFQVGTGERLAVLGENGSGKSTLLRVLAGVLTPLGGTVRLTVDGQTVPPHRLARAVGYAAPALQPYDALTATENLEFVARLRGLDAARVPAVLERVGLGGRGPDRVAAFSTGMRQRLRLATALLPDPPLLLLDEPGAALDEHGRALVREIVTAAPAVVLATNDPAEAALCGRSVRLLAARR